MSKKLLTQPEIEIRKLKAPYFIEKWAFIPLYALIFCEIFVNISKPTFIKNTDKMILK